MNIPRLTCFGLLIAFVLVGCEKPPPAHDPLAGWKSDGGYDPIMADSIRRMTGTRDALGHIITTSPAEYEKYAKECPFGSKVVADYESFLKKKKFYSYSIGRMDYLEDGQGQRAVRITTSKDGTHSTHILIYDSSDERVKLISYVTGHYAC